MIEDPNIRAVLRPEVRRRHGEGIVIDELSVGHGKARIDLAHLSPAALVGYEIKAERDNTLRLVDQSVHYSRVCSQVNLVVTPNHVRRSIRKVPEWWGIEVASEISDGVVFLEEVRPADVNPFLESAAMLRLLWTEELVVLCKEHEIPADTFDSMADALGTIFTCERSATELHRFLSERNTRHDWIARHIKEIDV